MDVTELGRPWSIPDMGLFAVCGTHTTNEDKVSRPWGAPGTRDSEAPQVHLLPVIPTGIPSSVPHVWLSASLESSFR